MPNESIQAETVQGHAREMKCTVILNLALALTFSSVSIDALATDQRNATGSIRTHDQAHSR
jgi:hypothetical protein